MLPMRLATGVCLLFVLWFGAQGARGAETVRREWLSRVPVVYQANHDPAVVVLGDGQRLFVNYDEAGGLGWKEVNEWSPGRVLALAYAVDTGPVLVDVATGRLLPVWGGWKRHPLDMHLDDREGRDGSTLAMVEWLVGATRLWQREMARLHRVLLHRASPVVRERRIEAQARWERFERAEMALIAAIDSEEEGTIGRVQAGSRRLALVRDRALQLYPYLE